MPTSSVTEKHSWLSKGPIANMATEVLDNHKEFRKRLDFYAGQGCDFMGEREFIYDQCLPLGGTLLEVGTGKGHFALTLARHGHRFISLDLNPVDQGIARMNLAYYGWEGAADFRLADAERLPFADGSVDAVLSVNVVHHLTQPARVGEEMVRVMKETGKIVLADFTAEGMALINRCHVIEGKSHDAFRRQMDAFRDFFDAKGFRHETRQSRHQEILIASRRTA